MPWIVPKTSERPLTQFKLYNWQKWFTSAVSEQCPSFRGSRTAQNNRPHMSNCFYWVNVNGMKLTRLGTSNCFHTGQTARLLSKRQQQRRITSHDGQVLVISPSQPLIQSFKTVQQPQKKNTSMSRGVTKGIMHIITRKNHILDKSANFR